MDLNKFKEILEDSKKVFITSHISPDGDAISSMLSIYDYLSKAFPEKEYGLFITSGEPFESYSFLKNFGKIQWVKDISDVVNQYDTLIFLDGNTLGRFTNEPEKIDLSKFKSICIDHHPSTPDNFSLNLSDPNQASCAQLVYKLFFRERKDLLNREVAEVILIGILSDSGTFRYLNYKKTDTLEFGKELIEFGQFDIQTLELKISQFEETEFELIKNLVTNTKNIEIAGKPSFTYSYLPLEVLSKGFSLDEIKSANASYKTIILRQIKNHNWGFVVTPDSETKLGLSFRSTPGGPNVQELAGHFNGGGHNMAAGGHMELNDQIKDSKDLCDLVIDYIKKNKLEMT